MKKSISLFLAVLIIIATMPMAFAADPIALTSANIVEYPIVTKKVEYGQPFGEMELDGGKVEYNGTTVPGHFEVADPTAMPLMPGDYHPVDLKFIPDSEDYSSFIYDSWNDMYMNFYVDVLFTTPVYDNPVASEIKPGESLSMSSIVGNVYSSNDKSKILLGVWQWVNPNTKVENDGEYEAYFQPEGEDALYYSKINIMIPVAVEKSVVQTEIIAPEISAITYDGVTTFGDLSLDGFKAVEKGTDKEVAGAFSIKTSLANTVIPAGTNKMLVTFTPEDTGNFTSSEAEVEITVNKGTVNFVDENGNVIVPEITLDRVLKVGSSLNGYLESYLNTTASFNWEETAGYRELLKPGTHELTVKTICDDKNFERYNTLTFKVNVNKEKVIANVQGVIGHQDIYFANGGLYQLGGDFDITYYIDGEKAGVLEGIKLGEKFALPTTKSGIYTLDVVYNPAADDMYEVTVTSPDPINFVLKYKATIEGKAAEYAAGETVTAVAATPDTFVRWSITDASGNPINVAITSGSLESYSIAFLMPEYDVVLTPEYKSADGGDIDIGIGDIDGIDGILAWLKNLIEKIKGIFETIIEFFRSIGDMT